MAVPRKGGLGKGLEALFVDNTISEAPSSTMKLSEIEPNKNQPRKDFDDSALAELADSIKQHGVLQPLLVRPMANGRYQIVAGERRWRASRMIGLTEVPVVIREMSDSQTMEIALIENLQREDLNAIEEALGYKTLMEEFSLTQEMIAQKVGRSRPAVANALRLLNLPKPIEEMIRKGELSSGHARALLALGDEAAMIETAQKVKKQGLTVREIEKLAAPKKQKAVSKVDTKAEKLNKYLEPTNTIWGDNFYKEMEIALGEELHRKVKVEVSKNKGTVTVEFYTKEELGQIAQRLVNRKIQF